MSGPLEGIRVVELAGIGPGPFAAMMLADMGAEVLRVDRASSARPGAQAPLTDFMSRGRRSVAVDLKHPEGCRVLLRLVREADVLLEGFRPGVMERLGLGPKECLEANPRLVYARMTGWGQDGPYARVAGHDINYIALSGTLAMIGRQGEPPLAPVNLLGDFGGGGMLMAFGVAAALVERARSGQGQVVDAAMVDGAALLATMIHGLIAAGAWGERGTNLLDSGSWFYDVYETKDGGWVAFGSLEPQFFSEMTRLVGLADEEGSLPTQMDRALWPQMRRRMAEAISKRTRAEWCEILEGSDSCFAPVLDPQEAPRHPHNSARSTFVESFGKVQPAPAPRFSRTPGQIAGPPPSPGQHTREALMDWGFLAEELDKLAEVGAIAP